MIKPSVSANSRLQDGQCMTRRQALHPNTSTGERNFSSCLKMYRARHSVPKHRMPCSIHLRYLKMCARLQSQGLTPLSGWQVLSCVPLAGLIIDCNSTHTFIICTYFRRPTQSLENQLSRGEVLRVPPFGGGRSMCDYLNLIVYLKNRNPPIDRVDNC